MKVLLIGMDSCHQAVFSRGWTPFISKMLQSKVFLDISTDLMSRGWLEIVLGRHGSITNALYDKPKANSTYEWTKEFSISEVPARADRAIPLWEALNDRGYSVGIMNVPTTFPAPSVKGFFISGGGGGAPVTKDVNPALCHPETLADDLNSMDYIVDERLYELVAHKGLDTPAKVFDRLAYKNDRRTTAFIETNKRFNVDFGFVVYKTSSVLAETFLLAEYLRRKLPENTPDETTVEAVKAYYQRFDAEIERLAAAFPEADIMFVSDHGTVERSFTVNPNLPLREAGLQTANQGKSALKSFVAKLKEIIPFWLKAYLKKSPAMKLKNVGLIDFDPRTTRGFCYTVENWAHGIFLNDVDRFGGPVTEEEKPRLIQQILELINSHPEARKHGIVASAAPDDRVNQFPDIVLTLPEGYVTSDKGRAFVEEFVPTKTVSALESITKGEMLYLKSHLPIACISRDIFDKLSDAEQGGDLTRIYHIILKQFKAR